MPQSERIIFNGHELSSQVPGAHVIDITIGNISIEHNSQARVARFGSIFTSKRDSVRPISIQVELPFDQEAAMVWYCCSMRKALQVLSAGLVTRIAGRSSNKPTTLSTSIS